MSLATEISDGFVRVAQEFNKIEAKSVERIISYCNGGQGAPTAYTITVNTQCGFRTAVKLPVTTTEWRLKLRNYSMLNGNKTAVTGKGIIFGLAAKVTSGTGTVSLTSGFVGNTATTVVNSDFTIPADGSWYTTSWQSASGDQFAANKEYLIGIAYQSAASLSVECSTGHCFMWTSTANALNPAIASGSTTPTGIPLDVVLEYRCTSSRKSILYIGDSIAEGVTGPRGTSTANWTPVPIWRNYPNQWAFRNNGLVTNMSLSANRVAQFLTSNNPRFFSRLDLVSAKFDAVVLAVGSNNFAADNQSLAAFQADYASLVAQIRATTGIDPDIPIYYGAIIPRTAASTSPANRRAANEWLAALPFGGAGFVDFDADMRSAVDADTSTVSGLLADMTTDNIHPSYKGVQRMAATLSKHLFR